MKLMNNSKETQILEKIRGEAAFFWLSYLLYEERMKKAMEVKEFNFVIVDTSKEFLTAYTLCFQENADEELEKAKETYRKNAEQILPYIEMYPEDAEYWRNRWNYYRNAKFEVMPYNDFLALQKERVVSMPIKEVSGQEYDMSLNVLPPLRWGSSPDNKYQQFFMREFYYGTYTTQYARDRKTGKCYSCLVDITDQNTWIHKRMAA